MGGAEDEEDEAEVGVAAEDNGGGRVFISVQLIARRRGASTFSRKSEVDPKAYLYR